MGDQVTPQTFWTPTGQDHSHDLAMQAWFCSRGANGAGQWPGDSEDFAKQIKARDEFEVWWSGRR